MIDNFAILASLVRDMGSASAAASSLRPDSAPAEGARSTAGEPDGDALLMVHVRTGHHLAARANGELVHADGADAGRADGGHERDRDGPLQQPFRRRNI